MESNTATIQQLKSFPRRDSRMPVLFIGHGSPMNAIEENEFSRYWKTLGQTLEKPEAVLVISAHWLTRGTHITAMAYPQTIHDFGGFPKELFDVQYPAPGNPQLVLETRQLIHSTEVVMDHDWGLDHGTWSVVRHMFPDAAIPVLQLSIDFYKPAAYHYNLAQELLELRRRGVLILGSGNMVHNLKKIDWQRMNQDNFGFDWAMESNELFKSKIRNRAHSDLIAYQNLGAAVQLAVPTPDHYLPLLYVLALQQSKEELEFFNDQFVGGSLNMTSVKIG